MGVRVSFSLSHTMTWLKFRSALFGVLCAVLIVPGCRESRRDVSRLNQEELRPVSPREYALSSPRTPLIGEQLSASVGQRLWVKAGRVCQRI